MKPQRLLTRLIVLSAMGVLLLGPALAEAGPKWRLRRWSTRPPIDPTIRTTTSFRRTPVATGSRYRHSVGRKAGFRIRY